MSAQIVAITDDKERTKLVSANLMSRFYIEFTSLADADPDEVQKCATLVIDLDLANPNVTYKLKKFLSTLPPELPKLFLTNPKSGTSTVQAQKLGATKSFAHTPNMNKFESCVKYFMNEWDSKIWSSVPKQEAKAFRSIEGLNESVAEAVTSGTPLPKSQFDQSSDLIISSLEGTSVSAWLENVKKHHSYTHRHCITVTGLAVAFGRYFRMRDADVHRLAMGALVHDIGKVRIPLNILDKPGALTEDERALMKKHPIYSYEILTADGQFDEEIIDMARHHHEYLDGSGYPDGLAGDQINNLVRIMTIIDVFSALIDKRSYKESMSRDAAYQVLQDMSAEGKIDKSFVAAFKPIALEIAFDQIQGNQDLEQAAV